MSKAIKQSKLIMTVGKTTIYTYVIMKIENYHHQSIIADKLSFDYQMDAVCRKAHQHIHCLHKLCGFNVDSTFMNMFY